MKIIIDRFEEKFARVELEDKTTLNMPKELIPKEAKEGDILEIKVNREETEKRRQEIEKRMEDLWE